MRRITGSLYFYVLLAIVGGVLLGHFFPNFAVQLKPLGDAFIRLIKMMIAPVIFCTIVTGIAGMEDRKKVGRVGIKSLVYFEVMTTLALLIGLLLINLFHPGSGMHINAATLDASAIGIKQHAPQSTTEFLLHIIPETIVGAFTQTDLLPVLFFSVLFGFGLSKIGTKAQPAIAIIQSVSHGLFAVINIIMKTAPIGALGAMSYTIGAYGIAQLKPLAGLMITFYLTCLLFIIVVLGAVLKLFGFSIFKLLSYIKSELLIVLGTSSSESALPPLIEKLENAGCSPSVVGLVIPAGYSFNLDGTSIYLTMAAVFIAQATDTPLDVGHQLSLLLVLLVTSKGAAGVTGSGFITLAATLPIVGHVPVAGLTLILGIDRFMSEARAITNIIGNATATVIMAKWEKEIDMDKAAVLQ
ncbi:dicarboxylate/amino acid:cation symporter [Ilyomonas limi]|uniref:Dicarboxylate/amino acid:cation symporter n=1 Tax=Ilyomonas limi TaxID=2575867 RepID=A0A4U3KZC6_9BACT|nr:dicarboxylate/amino acid:cation symporter [Ilyomonas limi]TKK67249.1 dicarboxylate/amino acid:cation symporter [Ilyomonas limi]